MAPRTTRATPIASIAIGLVLQISWVGAQQPAAPHTGGASAAVPQAQGTSGRAGAEKDIVSAASERYAAAEYEDALSLLDGVKPGESDTATRASVEEYRALCLLALGREDDARQAMVQLITLEPTYDVDRLNVAPSVKKRFLAVRAQILPGVARNEYEAGKEAFARKAYQEATPHLRTAVALSEAAIASGADDAGTRDINTLSQGFLDLASADAASEHPPTGDAASASPGLGEGNATKNVGEPPAKSASPRAPVITDPVAVRQDIPPISPQLRQLAGTREGVLELTVDPTGRVTRAVVRQSIYPVYDDLLIRAASHWRYQPGAIDGRPVARTVMVTVRPQ